MRAFCNTRGDFHMKKTVMDKIIKRKRGQELVTSCSSGYKTSSEKFLYQLCIIWPSLMMDYKVVFELFQKLHLQIYASQFMIPKKLFHFHLSFWIWKGWTVREKITKIWIFPERKELFWWNKTFFIVFEGPLFGKRIKIW